MPDDDEIVARVLAGERDAFGVLVERHTAYIYGVVRRFPTTDPAVDPEDVAQEVFVRAYVRLATYIPSGQFRAWLARIAANWCIDRQRRRRPVIATMDGPVPARPDTAPGPEAAVLQRERLVALDRALGQIPAIETSALLLCYGLGLNHREAGEALGVPQTTIKMRIYRGHGHLRALLAGVG